MPFAAPVLHHEAEVVRIEEQALRIAWTWRPQVDQEDDRELEAFRGMDREQRHRLRTGRLFGRLSDRQLRVDDLVEVAHEIPDPRERQVAFEATRQLKDLAQVEQRARAAVAVRPQLSPAQVSTLLEEAVEDVGHGQRVAQAADAVGQLDETHGLRSHLWIHLRKVLSHRLVEAIAESHAGPLKTPGGEPVHALVREPPDRPLQDAHKGPVVHRVLGQAEQPQHVLYLLAVEEAGIAAGHVRDALAPQLVLELAGKHADRMRQDSDLAKGAPGDVQPPDRLRHRARL